MGKVRAVLQFACGGCAFYAIAAHYDGGYGDDRVGVEVYEQPIYSKCTD